MKQPATISAEEATAMLDKLNGVDTYRLEGDERRAFFGGLSKLLALKAEGEEATHALTPEGGDATRGEGTS
ncbi:hypothetical protein LCGC14_3067380 [marine sediment metagenome]|uniref:Uncharacterized protein n=1 Tax=marine sediment metagenome TaxID=412755 RepID=A0A0F8YPT3_9ZZZZ